MGVHRDRDEHDVDDEQHQERDAPDQEPAPLEAVADDPSHQRTLGNANRFAFGSCCFRST